MSSKHQARLSNQQRRRIDNRLEAAGERRWAKRQFSQAGYIGGVVKRILVEPEARERLKPHIDVLRGFGVEPIPLARMGITVMQDRDLQYIKRMSPNPSLARIVLEACIKNLFDRTFDASFLETFYSPSKSDEEKIFIGLSLDEDSKVKIENERIALFEQVELPLPESTNRKFEFSPHMTLAIASNLNTAMLIEGSVGELSLNALQRTKFGRQQFISNELR